MTEILVYKFQIHKGKLDIQFDIDSINFTISIDDGDRVLCFELTKEELKALNEFINFVQNKY